MKNKIKKMKNKIKKKMSEKKKKTVHKKTIYIVYCPIPANITTQFPAKNPLHIRINEF